MAILTKIWGFISGKAGEWIGIGAAVLASVAFIRKSGADSVKLSQDEQTLKDVGIKNEIEHSNSNINAANELRKSWEQ